MNTEIQELRGKLISKAIFLEDEMDSLIITFMTPSFELTDHQKSIIDLIKKHFINGKTFGRKAEIIKEIINSDIFKKDFYERLISFSKSNNTQLYIEYENYNDLKSDVINKLSSINKIRNIVAHGKINYTNIIELNRIKSKPNIREFNLNDEVHKISSEQENIYNKNIEDLISLFKNITMNIAVASFCENI